MPSIKQVLIVVAILVATISVLINVLLMWLWSIPGIVEQPDDEYDYIIVGAGTSGSVVAGRLSEKCDCSILVVEAGTVAPWISNIPLVAPALQLTAADWAYKTVTQTKSHWGMHKKVSFWPRGKALGGSSAINYLVHMWGSRYDFDSNLVPLTGDSDLSFESVLPYFKKSEAFRSSGGSGNSKHRGTKGPLPVQELKGVPTDFASAFVKGASSLGLEAVDLNGDGETGVMFTQSNVENGRRVSAFDAYLKPVLGNYNTSLLLNTIATKVTFEGTKATGIQVRNLYTGTVHRVRSKREVILSAGSIGSPQILMLSGVGPRRHLRNMSIPVIADLPGVGENLQDHLTLPMYFHMNSSVSITTAKTRSVRHVWSYFFKGQGFLSTSGVQITARTTGSAKDKHQTPDIYYLLLNVGTVNEGIFKKISNMRDQVFRQSFPDAHNDSKEGFVLLPSCAYPLSRGNLVLASKDPLVPPIISPNYFDKKEDIRCFLRAIRFGARLGSTAPLIALGSRLHLPAYESCSLYKQSLEDDGFLECWLRTSAMTSYHPIGTCAMGQDHDPLAVLDSQFRLRKVQNIRVVDASALPRHTCGTPNAAIVMLAERAADLILKQIQTS